MRFISTWDLKFVLSFWFGPEWESRVRVQNIPTLVRVWNILRHNLRSQNETSTLVRFQTILRHNLRFQTKFQPSSECRMFCVSRWHRNSFALEERELWFGISCWDKNFWVQGWDGKGDIVLSSQQLGNRRRLFAQPNCVWDLILREEILFWNQILIRKIVCSQTRKEIPFWNRILIRKIVWVMGKDLKQKFTSLEREIVTKETQSSVWNLLGSWDRTKFWLEGEDETCYVCLRKRFGWRLH